MPPFHSSRLAVLVLCLQADVSVLLADFSLILTDEPFVLANEPLLFANESFVFADKPLVFANEPVVLVRDFPCVILPWQSRPKPAPLTVPARLNALAGRRVLHTSTTHE